MSRESIETRADNLQAHENSESLIPCVISAFAERGDTIFTIQKGTWKGLQISHSTIRWFDYNDLKSLEDRNMLLTVEKEGRGPLTRRFIITEGIFEEDGAMVDLPKHVIELKHKYKYRLILDESVSFGTVGRTGRGLTELYNIPATRIDMIVGPVANGSTHGAGFCAGSHIVADHQCINDTSFIFSAAAPALLTVSCFGGDQHLAEHAVDHEYANSTLQENVRMIRAVLDQVEAITIAIPSHAASPIIHIHLRSSAPTASVSAKPSNPATPAPREPPSFDIVGECLLQDIVGDTGTQAARAGAG
ncbi:pyridoxal phosphate-dependent transferase [Lactarius sanguifluus]|nr:pyridoxal phosphate-dependent transferase [Lactarius sanguifluus]